VRKNASEILSFILQENSQIDEQKQVHLNLCGFTRMSVFYRRLGQEAIQMSSIEWISNWLATGNNKATSSGLTRAGQRVK